MWSFTLCLLFASSLAVAQISFTPIAGISTNNLVYSGKVQVAAGSAESMFFTMFGIDGAKNEADLSGAPLVVFVGSPGSSALYQSVLSMGPIKLLPNMTYITNPDSVTGIANIAFLDLLGAGYSFANDVNNVPNSAVTFGAHVTYAVNAFANSKFGFKQCVIVGEGTFIRSLSGLDDIDCLVAIVHLSPWPEFYAMGRYSGVAGVDLKIISDSQRVAIESTYITCYNNARSGKFTEAHNCYNQVLNFVESKSKNANLFNVALGSNLTDSIIMAQYLFSLPATVSKWQAPSSTLFEGQSNLVYNLTYADMAKNYTQNITLFMKDYLNVKHWFVTADSDYIVYRKALKNWIQTELNFIDRDTFAKRPLDEVTIDGVTVAYSKSGKQVTYTEVLKSGHYISMDQPTVFKKLLIDFVKTLSQPRQIVAEK